MRVNAWEGQILRFTSPDTGQDRWNFADGDLRAPMKHPQPYRPDAQLTPELSKSEILFDPAYGEVSQVIRRQKVHHETAVQQ